MACNLTDPVTTWAAVLVEVEARSWPAFSVARWICAACGDIHEVGIPRTMIPQLVALGARVYRHRWAEERAALAGEAGRCGR